MIKFPFAIIAFVLMALLASTFGGNVEARAGPKLVPTPPPPRATATLRPSPTPTQETPTPTRTPTPTAIPTPTLDPVIEISAGWKIERSLIYLPTVLYLIEAEQIDVDPILVIAIIAAESGGDPWAVSSAGACGPMQVIPKPWHRYKAKTICKNSWVNLIMGMGILRGAINLADGDIRFALGYYNCSVDNVHNDGCGTKGGLHYADEVLEFWLPMIQKEMEAQ